MRIKTILLAAALAVAVPFGSTAMAALSNASFSYTAGPPGGAVLVLNGDTELTATNRGWYQEDGIGNNSQVRDGNGDPIFDGDGNPVLANNEGGNYLVGLCGSSDVCKGDDIVRNNYFVFDLSDFADAITSAVLQLNQPDDAYRIAGLDGYNSASPFLTYTSYDVGTNIDTLVGQDSTGVSIYNDLQSGSIYAATIIPSSSNGSVIAVDFNGLGLAALNRSIGSRFAVGGSINEAISVSNAPEPATWAMMIVGFGLVGAASRRPSRVRAVAN